jgi:AraC-like DNA-binding protein
MEYRAIQPDPAASPFIDRLWILTDDEGGGEQAAVQRVVPDGSPELILNLGRPFEVFQNGKWKPQSKCFLAGQITGPLRLRPNGPAKIIGVRFRPHGAQQVIGVPMHELTGRFPTTAELNGALARDLELAGEARDPLRTVQDVLLKTRVNPQVKSTRPDRLIAEAVRRMAQDGGCDVARLARELELSTRQLERRFQNAVGLSPKLFGRIQRFHRVFEVVESGQDWVTAALECGYYDQSHLVNDFREFSGEAPASLLAGDELARHFLRR